MNIQSLHIRNCCPLLGILFTTAKHSQALSPQPYIYQNLTHQLCQWRKHHLLPHIVPFHVFFLFYVFVMLYDCFNYYCWFHINYCSLLIIYLCILYIYLHLLSFIYMYFMTGPWINEKFIFMYCNKFSCSKWIINKESLSNICFLQSNLWGPI